jgi:hypothetical protein
MAFNFSVSFIIPYKKYPAPGGFYYAASIPVDISLPAKPSLSVTRSKRFDAIIDSGASACLFHASIGRAIGLEIEQGQVEYTQGVSGQSRIYLWDIFLHAPGGIIATRAGFSDDLPIAGLLGMRGFFENFKITFDPASLEVELDRFYQA